MSTNRLPLSLGPMDTNLTHNTKKYIKSEQFLSMQVMLYNNFVVTLQQGSKV